MPRSVRRLLVVLAVAGAGLVPAPAHAAQCSRSGGVSVVVDFNHGAGGGIETACDSSGGGKYASVIFEESGFDLSYVSGSPFVCKVAGRPSGAGCDRTPPANAYWGLFWAKPGSTSWTYSSLGVTALRVPDGGSVAFAFQDGGTTDYPGVAPASRTTSQPSSSPTPSKTPTSSPTKKPSSGATAPKAGAPAASASASGTTSASPSASATGTASPSATASASAPSSTAVSPPASAGEAATTTLAETDADSGGLPWWIPVAVVIGLALGGGAAWWTRRQRTT